ncbi:MAG: hypothetical protein EP307_08960 [Rhodobacteraceae bacterium]|nr:MAG: hypothetical protein EP307_08960 [Paracoccaceae bacterium]
MLLELVGTVLAGVVFGSMVMLARRWVGDRLPKWLVPVAAGAGMLLATISSEYGWYGRTLEIARTDLPQMVVATTLESRAPWRPWTYVVPYVERFVAVDGASLRTNPVIPGQRMVDLYSFGRWVPVSKVTVILDCEDSRRALLDADASFDAEGKVLGIDWIDVAEDDPVLRTGCAVS